MLRGSGRPFGLSIDCPPSCRNRRGRNGRMVGVGGHSASTTLSTAFRQSVHIAGSVGIPLAQFSRLRLPSRQAMSSDDFVASFPIGFDEWKHGVVCLQFVNPTGLCANPFCHAQAIASQAERPQLLSLPGRRESPECWGERTLHWVTAITSISGQPLAAPSLLRRCHPKFNRLSRDAFV